VTQVTQDIIEKISVQSQKESKGDEEKSAYLEKEEIKLEETKYKNFNFLKEYKIINSLT
jgi:hypothetical protein